MSNGKDFNEFLDEFAEMLADKLVEKSKIIEKNKALLEENKNLRQEKEYFQDLCNDLREKLIERYQKNILNEADKNILFYQEQNLKLMESNKALVEEVERLKEENKFLEEENKMREEFIKEIVGRLNGALCLDRQAISNLFAVRVPCNSSLIMAKNFQVRCYGEEYEKTGKCSISALGLLNGLVDNTNSGQIFVTFRKDGLIDKFLAREDLRNKNEGDK